MASGGGSHPSHLPIATPPSHGTSHSQSNSLQTPDTSALFVSSLGGRSGGGGNAGGTGNFAVTPLDQAQSFTSLEELLDITGINSMELGHSEMGLSKELVRGSHGVNSLQQLAREVEMKQVASNDAVAEPPSKRLCLDSSNCPTGHSSGHPLSKLPQTSSNNIRVQPLHLSPTSSSASYVPPRASPLPPQLQPPATLSSSSKAKTLLLTSLSPASLSTSLSLQSTPNSSTPIVSLLDKRQFSSSGNNGSLLDSLPSHHKQQQEHFSTSTGGFVDVPSKVLNHPLHVPPPYSFSVTSSISESIQTYPPPGSMEYQQKKQTGGFLTANATPNHHLPEVSMGQATSLTMIQPQVGRTSSTSRHPLPSILSQSSVASQAQRLNFATTNSHQTSTPPHTTAHAQNPRPAVTSTSNASQVAENINSNSKAVVVQLIQLYKQYQEANDLQGMARVREQINFLVSAQQKVLAAQNSVVRSGAASIMNGPANQPVSQSFAGYRVGNTVSGTATASETAATATKTMPVVGSSMGAMVPASQAQSQDHQQQADRILSQLSVVGKTSQLPSAQTQQHHQQQLQLNSATPLPVTGGVSVASPAMTKIQESPLMAGFAPRVQRSSGNGVGKGVANIQGDSGSVGSAVRQGVPVVANSAGVQATSGGTGGVAHGLSHMPPSLLGHISSGMSTHTTTSTTTTAYSTPAAQNQMAKNAQEDTQKTVKRIQMLMATLPDSKRPKTIQELKEFVQQYSSLINKGGGNFLSSYQGTTSSTSTASSSMAANSTSLPSYSERTRTLVAATIGLPAQAQAPVGKTAVTSHAFTSLPVRNSTMVGTSQTSSPRPPMPVPPAGGLMSSLVPSSIPPTTSTMASLLVEGATKHQLFSSSSSTSGTVHAPVTNQFRKPRTSLTSVSPAILETVTPQLPQKFPSASILPPTVVSQLAATSTAKSGIQAGVATPLPAGVTLETLGVLCRLPDSDLLKLNLPQSLLSAIKVWKVRQGPVTKTKVPSASSKSNIPVLVPPPAYDLLSSSSVPVCSGPMVSSSMVTMAKTSLNHTFPPSLPPHSKSLLGQPNVIPSGAGFPPRSLHAFIPRPTAGTGGTTPLHQTATSSTHHSSQHMTRYKIKMEQHKAETERLQVLQKALQSSEEARIAYRFSAHLDKMHNQLMSPDTVSSFKSQHDILARLLPYHLYAEPEPPPAAVEKADAVYESVAQVLLSRSRGLKSRFERIMLKTESQGGLEQSKMRYQLEQLFVEGEQERIQKENREKKEAEQIAADLSLMADTVDSFDPDFSIGDVFSPLMSMNSGVT